jgi:hypothetical protein
MFAQPEMNSGRGGGGQDDVLAHGKLLLNRWERAVR